MINYTDIEANILTIETKYSDPSTSTHEKILYSKLAVLEFCGWIEESLDQVIKDYLNVNVSHVNQIYSDNNFIKKNSGFEYDKYTRKMFCSVLGIKNLENLENTLNSLGGHIVSLDSILSSYTTIRNRAAHNSTPIGTTLTFNSPSIILSDFRRVKTIFTDLEISVNCL